MELSKRQESWFPMAAGLAVALGYLFVPGLRTHEISDDTAKALFSSVVGFSGILAGFLATTKSILFAIGNRRAIRLLKSAGVFSDLISYQLAAVNLSFTLAVLSAFALLVDTTPWTSSCSYMFAIWLFLLVWSGMACYRVIRLLSKTLLFTEKKGEDD